MFSQIAVARSAVKAVHLVETSPAMQQAQRDTLQPISQLLHCDLSWHDTLHDVQNAEDVYTIILAHEFFDALPFHLLLVHLYRTSLRQTRR